MPIYEYQCKDCEVVFEALRSMSQADEPINCEKCLSANTVRMISLFAAHSDSGVVAGRQSAGCAACTSAACGSCSI